MSGAFEELRTSFHGRTYTGDPLACATALATLDVFEEERTLERLAPLQARRRGALVRPLGDTVVLMPPLAIGADELRRLVEITAAAIEGATAPALDAAA